MRLQSNHQRQTGERKRPCVYSRVSWLLYMMTMRALARGRWDGQVYGMGHGTEALPSPRSKSAPGTWATATTWWTDHSRWTLGKRFLLAGFHDLFVQVGVWRIDRVTLGEGGRSGRLSILVLQFRVQLPISCRFNLATISRIKTLPMHKFFF